MTSMGGFCAGTIGYSESIGGTIAPTWPFGSSCMMWLLSSLIEANDCTRPSSTTSCSSLLVCAVVPSWGRPWFWLLRDLTEELSAGREHCRCRLSAAGPSRLEWFAFLTLYVVRFEFSGDRRPCRAAVLLPMMASPTFAVS